MSSACLLRLLSCRMIPASVVLVTHSSSLEMPCEITPRLKLTGSISRLTNGMVTGFRLLHWWEKGEEKFTNLLQITTLGLYSALKKHTPRSASTDLCISFLQGIWKFYIFWSMRSMTRGYGAIFLRLDQEHRANLLSALFFFMCITQHTGRMALHPIQKRKQLWKSVLLKVMCQDQESNLHSNPMKSLGL